MTSTVVYNMWDGAVSCPWRCSCAERGGCTPIPTSPALWQTARTSASTPRSHTATVIPSTGSCSSPNQSLHLRNERERARLSPETLHFTVHTSLQLSSVNCPIVPTLSIVNCPPNTASLIWLSMNCSYSTLCLFLSINLEKHHYCAQNLLSEEGGDRIPP